LRRAAPLDRWQHPRSVERLGDLVSEAGRCDRKGTAAHLANQNVAPRHVAPCDGAEDDAADLHTGLRRRQADGDLKADRRCPGHLVADQIEGIAFHHGLA